MNEAERRGYKKVRITGHVCGWPVGTIAYLREEYDDDDGDRCYNEDCSDYWYHTVGFDCEFVEDRPTETGTLAELNVKPGDVVEWGGGMHTVISAHVINKDEPFGGQVRAELSEYGTGIFGDEKFTIISRADQTDQTEASPVRTVTRTEIVPGVYGRVLVTKAYNACEIDVNLHTDDIVAIDEAIATLTQIRDALRD